MNYVKFIVRILLQEVLSSMKFGGFVKTGHLPYNASHAVTEVVR